jgi:hypothetical protein
MSENPGLQKPTWENNNEANYDMESEVFTYLYKGPNALSVRT